MWGFLVATILDNSDIEHFQRHGPSSIRQSALGQGFSTAPLLKTWLIFYCGRAVLCIVRFLAASLASIPS